MALGVVVETYPALEVHLPQQIWRRHLKALNRYVPADRLLDPAGAMQDLMDRRKRWWTAVLSLQAPRNLASSPRRVGVAYRKDTLLDLLVRPLRARVRAPRPVGKLLIRL